MTSLSVGDSIGGYRLDELVGRGGMGVVYRATHIALERRCAVKLIAPELAANEDFRNRFQRESRLAASIDHAHVIPIFDAGSDSGHLYVAMRFVEGTDLGAFIAERGRLEPAEAVELVAQTGSALDAAHALGLVHRDVKPANVLLEARPDGHHAYLTDFGLVKALGAPTGVQTRTGHWLGTPDYAAPEQVMGAEVDARTDVYALGCMLFQTIAGKAPFERDHDVAKVFAHLSEAPPSLSEARPGIPAGLDEVVRTALAKLPDERYASAGGLAAAARTALAGGPAPAPTLAGGSAPTLVRPSSEAPGGPAGRSPDAAHGAPPASAGARPAREARRGSRRLLPLAAAAAVVLVGVVVLVLALAGGGDGGGGDATGGGGGGAGDSGGGNGGAHGADAPIPEGNLTANASFEGDTEGWDFFEADIASVPAADAPAGERVARVTWVGAPEEYSIDDDPETVASSKAGRIYTASAWVKASDANNGKPICISLRERLEDGGDFPFSAGIVNASSSEYRELQGHPSGRGRRPDDRRPRVPRGQRHERGRVLPRRRDLADREQGRSARRLDLRVRRLMSPTGVTHLSY